MRILYLIILLLISTSGFTQEDSTTLKFLSDIVLRKNDTSSIYYTEKVDAGMYDYMMKKKLVKRTVKDIGNTTHDKLVLTVEEVTYLKQYLITAKDKVWSENVFINSKRISADSTHSFLTQNRNRDLYLFSQPIFIRNNTIVLFYVIHLCCGGIYGPVDLSFYRKAGDTWKKWLRVDGGAF